MSTKWTWDRQLQKMILQAEHQQWWNIAASLYVALSEVRKLTEINRKKRQP